MQLFSHKGKQDSYGKMANQVAEVVLTEEMLCMRREEGEAAGSRGEPGGIMFQVGDQPGPVLTWGQVDVSLGCLKHKEASQ